LNTSGDFQHSFHWKPFIKAVSCLSASSPWQVSRFGNYSHGLHLNAPCPCS